MTTIFSSGGPAKFTGKASRIVDLSHFMFLSLSGVLIAGCNQTDLSDYRPAKDQVKDTVVEVYTETNSDADAQQASTNRLNRSSPTSEAEPVELPVSAMLPVNVVDSIKTLLSAYPTSNSDANASNPAQTVVQASVKPESDEPRKVEVLVKEKKFVKESKTGALRVSFDDLDLLKVLNMDPVTPNAVELMPDWLTGLSGKTVRIRGFMFPTYEAEGIERFILARDTQLCCFGPNAKVYDLIAIEMKPGKTTNYIPKERAFDVVGTLKIDLQGQDGKLFGLYAIDQAIVIER